MSQKPANLRVIQTARSVEAINQGVLEGYRPLVQLVDLQSPFEVWYQVFQHPETGRVIWLQNQPLTENFDGMVPVISWESYRPVRFQQPFAAYLLPKDLQIGEQVWLDDVIADYPDLSRQPLQRLNAAIAVWNGKMFEIEVPQAIIRESYLGGDGMDEHFEKFFSPQTNQ